MPRAPRKTHPDKPLPRRPIVLVKIALAALAAIAALLLTADWLICLPEGAVESATYVGRQVCAECHEKEMELWTGSDHDLAMDRARPETMLADFNDSHFTHLAFDDLLKLSEEEVRTAAQNLEPSQWAMALQNPLGQFDAELGQRLKDKILQGMSQQRGLELEKALEDRKILAPVRPSDVADAHREIGDVLRRLKDEGLIEADFAVTSKMFRRGDEFFITTDNADGQPQTFPIKYVFGVRPLQQYLVEFPDGRVQCLPVTWDTENKSWYHLYPKEPIPHDDVLHWTRPLQNWNYMCAECHTTNLKKNYNLAENTYHTTWSEIDVSCETCHGPGSVHVDLANQWGVFWDRRHGYGLPRLKDENPRVEIETCAPCHSRRRIVHPQHRSGQKLLEAYLPEVLDNNLYYADGQILEEDYVYSSFIQSRMYREKVRCSDCHDPHSMRVKFEDPKFPRPKVTDNRLCGQCHLPTTYDTPSHHHHPDESKPGTGCVECHMPETKYMVVDPRRDHSIRIPRPDLTVWLDIPNACNTAGCHDDVSKGETPEWAAQQALQWYGKPDGPPHFAYAIAAGREGKPEAERQLADVAKRKDVNPIVRASAISLLARYGNEQPHFRALEGLKDPDELVRAVTVRSLEHLSDPELHRRLSPMLHDPVRAVRSEAARMLSVIPRQALSREDGDAFDVALAEYVEGQEAVNDQSGAHLNMGVVYSNTGQYGDAETEYLTALRLDPQFMMARNNLVMLYDTQGKKDKAEEQLREMIELEPQWFEVHYKLGLLLAENEQRLEEAGRSLATAAQLAPGNPRIHYNHGLAMQKLGKAGEAEGALLAALKISPQNVDYLYALTILYVQQENWVKAEACARQMCRLQPGNQQFQHLLRQITQQAKA